MLGRHKPTVSSILRTLAGLLACSCCLLSASFANAGEIGYETVPKKDGMGAIDRNVFIPLSGNVNKIILEPLSDTNCDHLKALPKCRHLWVGDDAGTPQIVLTDGIYASDSAATGMDMTKLVIVMFYPTEVRFINLRNNTSGKFLR